MTEHQTADFDLHPRDGWFSAVCTCGHTDGAFPDAETMVDALMEHVRLATVRELSELKPSAALTTALRNWINSYADDGEAEEALSRAAQELDG